MEKLAYFPPSFPHLVLGLCHRQLQCPLHTQVDMPLPANGDAPHRWEKQLYSKSLALVLLSFITPFISTKCFSGIKRDCLKKNPTTGFPPLSRLNSLQCPETKRANKDTVDHSDSGGMYWNLYKKLESSNFLFESLRLCGCWRLIHIQTSRQPFSCLLKISCSFVIESSALQEKT